MGFGQAFQWDVPLRQGYVSRVLGVAARVTALPLLFARLRRAISDIRPDAVLIPRLNYSGLALV